MNRLLLFLFLTPSLLSSQSINDDIPYLPDFQLKIDGMFHESAWQSAKNISLTDSNRFYLAQNDTLIFLGMYHEGVQSKYVDLFLSNESIGTINLHASMQLGERQLTANWDDSSPAWNWGNNTLWTANHVEMINHSKDIPLMESIKPYQGYEFQIDKRKLQGTKAKIRLEVRDFQGKSEDLIFPENSTRKHTAQWFELILD